jgi:hypothetical protein
MSWNSLTLSKIQGTYHQIPRVDLTTEHFQFQKVGILPEVKLVLGTEIVAQQHPLIP